MKIGIMTCWQPNDNYGTQVQCFALQRYLSNIGHDVYLIQYVRANDVVGRISLRKVLKAFNPYLVAKKIYSIFQYKKMGEETANHDRSAPQFREKYLNLSRIYNNYNELVSDPPKANLYIVGSDQVWNNIPFQTGQFNSFFLDFGDDTIKRISYAASFGFGCEFMPKKYDKFAIPLLKKFNGISIREKSGLSMLKSWGFDDSVLVPDPTLLLSAKEYRRIYSENKFSKRNRKYVLLYNLSSKSNINCVKIKIWAESKGLDFVYVTGHGQLDRFEKCYATIPQWLYLIDNAEYVFTNSFHGSIFSALFHKQFVVFKLCSDYEVTNSRLNIIEELVSPERIVSSLNEAKAVINNPIDWVAFENKKSSYVMVGKEFLDKYLSSNRRT